MALSNRYPAGQRGKPVRHSRPAPMPSPDNDNTPGKSRPRPRPSPANDNRPGRPVLPRALGVALRVAARRSAYGIASQYIHDLIKEHVSPWIYSNLQAALLSDFKLDFKCKSGHHQWNINNMSSCLLRQSGLAASMYSTPGAVNAAHPNHPNLTQWFGPYPHPLNPAVSVWDVAANFSRVTGNQNQPEIDDVPWPDHWPVPSPEAWPVGVPRPVRAPNVRGEPNVHPSNNSSSTSSSPFPRTSGAVRPFNRPRRPPPGTKERKIRGQGLLKIFGRGLSTYSEVGDFIDSLWGALPKRYQTKGGHLGDKMMDLYENINEIDIAKAVENLIKNEIEDRIVGKLIGRATKTFGNNLGNALVSGGRAGTAP